MKFQNPDACSAVACRGPATAANAKFDISVAVWAAGARTAWHAFGSCIFVFFDRCAWGGRLNCKLGRVYIGTPRGGFGDRKIRTEKVASWWRVRSVFVVGRCLTRRLACDMSVSGVRAPMCVLNREFSLHTQKKSAVQTTTTKHCCIRTRLLTDQKNANLTKESRNVAWMPNECSSLSRAQKQKYNTQRADKNTITRTHKRARIKFLFLMCVCLRTRKSTITHVSNVYLFMKFCLLWKRVLLLQPKNTPRQTRKDFLFLSLDCVFFCLLTKQNLLTFLSKNAEILKKSKNTFTHKKTQTQTHTCFLAEWKSDSHIHTKTAHTKKKAFHIYTHTHVCVCVYICIAFFFMLCFCLCMCVRAWDRSSNEDHHTRATQKKTARWCHTEKRGHHKPKPHIQKVMRVSIYCCCWLWLWLFVCLCVGVCVFVFVCVVQVVFFCKKQQTNNTQTNKHAPTHQHTPTHTDTYTPKKQQFLHTPLFKYQKHKNQKIHTNQNQLRSGWFCQ